MRKLLLILGVAALLICVACGTGGSGSSGGFGGGGTVGSFSNSNLKGSYAYEMVGIDLSPTGNGAPFREAGVFVADGNGNITGGEDDFAEGASVVTNQITSTTAAYSVSSDGTASLTLNFNNGGGAQLALSVASAPTIYLSPSVVAPLATGLSVNGSGFAVPQTTSAISTPSGTFVFRAQSLNTALGGLTPGANVGVFTVSGGSVSGSEDQIVFGSSESQLNITGGVFNAPDSFGRGTGSFTDSTSHTTTFNYYVVDSMHLHLFSSVTGTIGLGRAAAQTSTSLSGSYVFGSKGDDSAFLGGVNTAGQFTASGGNIASSGGTFDTAQDGTVVNGTYTGGSYTMAGSGRSVVTLTSSGGSVEEVYWVVSPSLAFFLTNDSAKVEAGTATAQSISSFSNSSVNGTLGFGMDGFTTPDGVNIANLYDRVGNLHFDGAGHLGLTEFLNTTGSQQLSGIINGTYTIGSNGRAVGSISNLSSNIIIYLASGTDGYMVQADSGVEINGMTGTAQ